MTDPLANPPIIDTDIATNEQFYTRSIHGQAAYVSLNHTTAAGLVGPPAVGLAWSYYADLLSNTVSELRALNPTLSAANPDDALTVGFVQSGSQYLFPLPGLAYNVHHAAQPPPANNFDHHYGRDAVGIIAMDNAPVGHGPDRQGIWAMYETADGSYNGTPALHAAFHSRSGKPKDYTTRWQTLADYHVARPPDDRTLYGRSFGACAAQRLGDWVYLIGWAANTVVTNYSFDVLGNVIDTRTDQTGRLVIKKVGPSGTASVLDQTISTEGQSGQFSQVPLFGLDYVNVDFVGVTGRSTTFVSDDAVPFLWHTSGDISADINNGPIAWAQGFTDSGAADLGNRLTDGTLSYLTGQIAAFTQEVRRPVDAFGFGPTLVFPWTSGNYGPPELWFMIMVGTSGSLFDIYRAKWQRGAYIRSSRIVLADDDSFQTGARQFPSLNPDGWAFEQNWFKPANKVARVGPFARPLSTGQRIADVFNPLGGSPYPTADQITFPYFRVLRDQKRIGQLHLVWGDGKPPGSIA